MSGKTKFYLYIINQKIYMKKEKILLSTVYTNVMKLKLPLKDKRPEQTLHQRG